MIKETGKRRALTGWRLQLYDVIFGYDTLAGKAFDVGLIIAIIVSIFAVMLESVDTINARYSTLFFYLEWVLTVIFTLEYIARLICVGQPIRYVFSFYGIVDLLSLLPSYLALIFPPAHFLSDIRALRLLRANRR